MNSQSLQTIPTLNGSARKVFMVFHIGTSVGLLGAVLSFFVLATLAWRMDLPDDATNLYAAAEVLTKTVILPLLISTLVIGTAQALMTPLGFVPSLVGGYEIECNSACSVSSDRAIEYDLGSCKSTNT